MIDVIEIQNKEFTRAVRGYNDAEVDDFLDKIIVEIETLQNENASLKLKLAEQEEKLGQYKAQEGAVLSTLETAKSLMSDISASAEKRADILIKNAQLDADLQLRQAKDSVEKLKEEEGRLSQRVASLKMRMKDFLQSEIERMDGFSDEIFTEMGIEGNEVKNSLDASAESFLNSLNAGGDAMSNTIVNVRGDK